MITRRNALGMLAAGVVLPVLTSCGSTDTFRYKMTVEVETPEGLRTGFAVREISYFEPAALPALGESRPQWRVTGEAVAVDLPGERTLFALLTSASGDVDFAARVADREGLWRNTEESRWDQAGRAAQVWPRPPYTGASPHEDYKRAHALAYPMLVAFRDINDPTSVEQVEPDALEAAFGPGVRLRRITIAVTDEAVNKGIAGRLKWLIDPSIMRNPGWSSLPLGSRRAINGLSSNIGEI